MGTFGEAYTSILVDSEKDAIRVNKMLDEIEKLVSTEAKPVYFNITDRDSELEDVEIIFRVSSTRYQNTKWQVEQIIEQLKKLVSSGEISPDIEFKSDVMIVDDSYYLDEEDFSRNLKTVE